MFKVSAYHHHEYDLEDYLVYERSYASRETADAVIEVIANLKPRLRIVLTLLDGSQEKYRDQGGLT
jgi:DNA-directed RNA polymerase specialized sigma24 family protein